MFKSIVEFSFRENSIDTLQLQFTDVYGGQISFMKNYTITLPDHPIGQSTPEAVCK